MLEKLHLCMKPTNRTIKDANCGFKKCLYNLSHVTVSMVNLVVLMDSMMLEETKYVILIELLTLIQLRARPEYYRMVL